MKLNPMVVTAKTNKAGVHRLPGVSDWKTRVRFERPHIVKPNAINTPPIKLPPIFFKTYRIFYIFDISQQKLIMSKITARPILILALCMCINSIVGFT